MLSWYTEFFFSLFHFCYNESENPIGKAIDNVNVTDRNTNNEIDNAADYDIVTDIINATDITIMG